MPDADVMIDQIRERVRKKAADGEKRDIEERAMEYLTYRISDDVKKIVVKNAKNSLEESMDDLVSDGSLMQVAQIQRLASEEMIRYIKEGVSKQLDEKTEDYVQKEAKEQTVKVARGLEMYKEISM